MVDADVTGDRVWDCSRLLQRLLTSSDAAALCPPPSTVVELGAGTGALAVALAGHWHRNLDYYAATDKHARIAGIEACVRGEGCTVVCAVELLDQPA